MHIYKKATKTSKFSCLFLDVMRMNLHQMRDHLNKKITHFINFVLVFPAAVLLQEGLGKEKGLVTHLNESELIINYHSVFSRGHFLLTRSFVSSSRFPGVSAAPVTWLLAERFLLSGLFIPPAWCKMLKNQPGEVFASLIFFFFFWSFCRMIRSAGNG